MDRKVRLSDGLGGRLYADEGHRHHITYKIRRAEAHMPLGASFKGKAGLIAAIVVVIGLLIGFPAYRWFFAISLGIGIVVAAILFLWHRLHPVRAEDVDDKRPLKLD